MQKKQKYSDGGKKGDKKNAIIFGGKEIIPSVRFVADMENVILNQEWAGKNKNQPLYFMYRDLTGSEKDAEKIKEANVRYDILETDPVCLGGEFNKTAGHYHSTVKGTILSYPELYELIDGDAYYLMQKVKDEKVVDIYAVRVTGGDKVIVPPDYGHFTIFLSKEPLRMSNWTSSFSQSDYEQVRQKHGAAYYAIADKDAVDGVLWVKNGSYSDTPALRFLKPTNFVDLGLDKKVNMYNLVNDLEKLDYLNNPQKYPELWKRVLDNK